MADLFNGSLLDEVENKNKLNIVEWIEYRVEDLLLNADSDDISYAAKNMFSIKQFIDIFHIEDISYFKYYGDKTLVYIDTDVYGVDGDYLDLMRALNTEVLTIRKHIQFCKIPGKYRIVLNVNKVLDVNKNTIELMNSTFPIKGVLNEKEVESFKACITVLKG